MKAISTMTPEQEAAWVEALKASPKLTANREWLRDPIAALEMRQKILHLKRVDPTRRTISIARELGVSRQYVWRVLKWAKQHGN